MSDKGVLGRRIPPSRESSGGDCGRFERRGRCRTRGINGHCKRIGTKIDVIEPESSQPLLLCIEDEDEDTETRRDMACGSTSFLISSKAGEPEILLDCLRDSFPVRMIAFVKGSSLTEASEGDYIQVRYE